MSLKGDTKNYKKI